MDSQLNSALWTLRIAFGLTALLAGLDKFLNLLTDWEQYLSPVVASVVPLAPASMMRVVGVIEIAAGAAVLAGLTRIGGYVVAAWLTLIAASLVAGGTHLDVAVRDLVMACGAWTMARVTEARGRVSEDLPAERPLPARAS